MRFLARFTQPAPPPAVPEPVPPAPAEPAADNVVMRFLTVGGATVAVTGHYNYYACCQGCGWQGGPFQCWSDTPSSLPERRARNAANAHAAECRAMPRPETTP